MFIVEAVGKKIVLITAALVSGFLTIRFLPRLIFKNYGVIGQMFGAGVATRENVDVLQWAEVLVQESLGKFEMTQLNQRLFLFLQPGEDVRGGGGRSLLD